MQKISTFFSKIKKWCQNHKNTVALIITLLFVCIHIPMIQAHEFSSDEGVVWGLSKEINISNIYDVNSVEPHPLLWEIILAPFSQNGFPMITMNYISLFFVAIAVFLFVRFAPISGIGKIIFILSSSFFYFNPVIARDYSLIPLAICIICLAYKNRHKKPLLYGISLAFLAQTHFLMYGLLAALVISFIIEESFEKKKASKIIFTILAVAIPVVLSVATTMPEVIGSLKDHAIIAGKNTESELYTTDFYMYAIGTYFGIFVEVMRWIVGIYFGIIIIFILATNMKIGTILISSIGFWFFVMNNIYKNYYVLDHKVIIVSLILLAVIWMLQIEKNNQRKENIISKILNNIELVKFMRLKAAIPVTVLIYLFVACTIPRAIVSAKNDMDYKYSNFNDVAAFINEKIEENSLVIEGDISTTYSFSPATYAQVNKNITFYNGPLNSFDDYMTKLKYDGSTYETYANFENYSDESLKALFADLYEKYDHIYYIGVVGKNCKGDKLMYNQKLLDEYKEIGTLNTDYYIEQSKPELKVYKIK